VFSHDYSEQVRNVAKLRKLDAMRQN
jgi:hypothetical protein